MCLVCYYANPVETKNEENMRISKKLLKDIICEWSFSKSIGWYRSEMSQYLEFIGLLGLEVKTSLWINEFLNSCKFEQKVADKTGICVLNLQIV